MSTKTKFIIGFLFLVQIGIIGWVRFDYEANKSLFEKRLDLYLDDAENVRILDFNDFELTELPDEISKFQNTEIVILSNNRFQKIPSVLYQLPNLKELNMSHNYLFNISLRKFKNITHLNFSYNGLTEVNGQSYIETLKNLDLSHNLLTDFPALRVDMDTINLAYNQLYDFQNVASKLSKITQHLDLSNNEFSNFDNARLIANNCYSLDLSNNKPLTLSETRFPSTLFSEDFMLQKLFLNNCSFKYLDVIPASQLEVLDIGNNYITITDQLVHQLKLKELNLEKHTLYNFFLVNLSLKEVNLVDVLIIGNFEILVPNLETLHVSESFENLRDFPDLPNLKTIYYYSESETNSTLLQSKYPNANIVFRIKK